MARHPGVRSPAVDAEAQGDQVEPAVAARGSVPVDDAGDRTAGRQQVSGVEVHVHGIVAGQPVGMARTDGGDPPLQRGTATVVPAQRLVQAVAGAVLTQEQLRGGNIGMPGEPAGLRPVEFEGLDQTAVVQAVDRRTGQQLLHRHDRVAHLGHQLGVRNRTARAPQHPADGERPRLHVRHAGVRPPSEHGAATVRPAHIGGADLPAGQGPSRVSRTPVSAWRASSIRTASRRSARAQPCDGEVMGP